LCRTGHVRPAGVAKCLPATDVHRFEASGRPPAVSLASTTTFFRPQHKPKPASNEVQRLLSRQVNSDNQTIPIEHIRTCQPSNASTVCNSVTEECRLYTSLNVHVCYCRQGYTRATNGECVGKACRHLRLCIALCAQHLSTSVLIRHLTTATMRRFAWIIHCRTSACAGQDMWTCHLCRKCSRASDVYRVRVCERKHERTHLACSD
jgi:hypothetical protein